ncbi:transposase [Pedobacter sp. KR3-3]|uniref:Transposase n=1 Tax=Pedobacter albus TaxID=3113905 RepID=A0ABU7IB25_9SPHI|nr:transposase [Pedobacter sp. KR3-3]MEE1946685.1 transposase [Pedobacter sp. KR3-3]
MVPIATYHPQFFTVAILKWQNLLLADERKEIVISSLNFLHAKKRIKVYAFVIMPNHIHLIWQVMSGYLREDVQRDFLKFTAQQLLKTLRNGHTSEMKNYYVGLKDRKYQIWQRNALSKDLWSEAFFLQKLGYIHNNPCQPKWMLVDAPEDYYYSSASFYKSQQNNFSFLSHYSERMFFCRW